jgi:hypothetical protein
MTARQLKKKADKEGQAAAAVAAQSIRIAGGFHEALQQDLFGSAGGRGHKAAARSVRSQLHRAVDALDRFPHWQIRGVADGHVYYASCASRKQAKLIAGSTGSTYQPGFPDLRSGIIMTPILEAAIRARIVRDKRRDKAAKAKAAARKKAAAKKRAQPLSARALRMRARKRAANRLAKLQAKRADA